MAATITDRDTTSISVRLDNDLIDWLEQVATKENRTRSNLIETVLKEVREYRTKNQRA